MNGAESLIRTLLASGVDVCFTNPGTSEIHMVAALDRVSEMRCVLGLFEGVVAGAADGYARMAGKPACTLLHLGPGLANSLANLHNASRAQVPIINLVGQHAMCHLHYDTPLTSNIEGIARPYSRWLRTSRASSELGRDAAEAVVAARTAPGQIATLIVPADVSWIDGGSVAKVPELPEPPPPDNQNVERAAVMLRSGLRTAMLISGNALYGRGLLTAARIAAATGAKLLAPYPITRLQRGAGIPRVDRVQYVLEQGIEQFKQFRQLILVGAQAPVAYFAYPGKNSVFTSPECEIHRLAVPGEGYTGALDALAAALAVRSTELPTEKAGRPAMPSGEITLQGLAAAVGYLEKLGIDKVHAHETALVRYASERLAAVEDVVVLGPPPERRGGVASFTLRDVHPHDLSQLLDAEGIAVRAGHHCAQPLMRALGVNATTRASFYVYNDSGDVDALVSAVARVREKFTAAV